MIVLHANIKHLMIIQPTASKLSALHAQGTAPQIAGCGALAMNSRGKADLPPGLSAGEEEQLDLDRKGIVLFDLDSKASIWAFHIGPAHTAHDSLHPGFFCVSQL